MDSAALPSDPSSLLTRLIIAGEAAITLRRSGHEDDIAALCASVAHLADKPADGIRVIDEMTVLYARALQMCDRALHRHDRRKAASFGRVVAVLMEEIRCALGEAIEQRKRPSA